MAKGIYAGVTKTLGDYAEGDIIQLNESGSPVDFYVAKHNYESGLNGAGRTLLVRRYPYATIAWDDNRKNAYATSTSDTWLNSTYKSQLDENVRNALGVTSFYYTPGNGDNTVGTLSRAVFMLSMTEIGMNNTGSFNTEGTKITSCMLKPVKLPGSADNVPQWSRTPSITQLGYAFNEINGVENPSNTMSASPYVRPAFTLPSTFEMIPDKARKVKKMYVGVDSLARKVKKAYVGVGGVAKMFYKFCGPLVYYGKATPSLQSEQYMVGVSVGNYALIAGGGVGSHGSTDVVTAYSDKLVQSAPSVLSEARGRSAATCVGNYAIIGGGTNYDNNPTATVDAYSNSLTHTTVSGFTLEKASHAAATVGDYAIFAGGLGLNWGITNKAAAINSSLTQVAVNSLANSSTSLEATSIGNYAIFAGGTTSTYDNNYAINIATAYDGSLTKTIPTPLFYSVADLAATYVGNYALFGGGDNGSKMSYVTVYDTSLVRTGPLQLSKTRSLLAATSLDGHAIFGGGNAPNPTNVVDSFDESLTQKTETPLSEARHNLTAVSVGDYALFSAGNGNSTSGIVDVYTIS